MRADNLEKLRNIVRHILEIPDGESIDSVRKITCRRWDSLAQVLMIAAIESEFKIEVSVSDFERFTSFDAIRLLLEDKGF